MIATHDTTRIPTWETPGDREYPWLTLGPASRGEGQAGLAVPPRQSGQSQGGLQRFGQLMDVLEGWVFRPLAGRPRGPPGHGHDTTLGAERPAPARVAGPRLAPRGDRRHSGRPGFSGRAQRTSVL